MNIYIYTNHIHSMLQISAENPGRVSGEKQQRYSVLARQDWLDAAVSDRGPMSQPKKRSGSWVLGHGVAVETSGRLEKDGKIIMILVRY